MKKLVTTGEVEVVEFMKKNFSESAFDDSFYPGYFLCFCGFVCPEMRVAFEVFEEIEFPEKKSLKPGIYRVRQREGTNTAHTLTIEKWENFDWKHCLFGHAGWADDIMPDWRGIRRVDKKELSQQMELPL